MKANLVTGKIEEGEGDPALAGAHARPDLDREIDRQVKRMAKEEYAKRKAERLQLKADREFAKAILVTHGVKMAERVMATIKIPRGQAIKRLKRFAWFEPQKLIEFYRRMYQEGAL